MATIKIEPTITRSSLRAILKKHEVNLRFRKLDGEITTRLVTLKEGIVPKYSGEPGGSNKANLTVYDIQNTHWITIPLENLRGGSYKAD